MNWHISLGDQSSLTKGQNLWLDFLKRDPVGLDVSSAELNRQVGQIYILAGQILNENGLLTDSHSVFADLRDSTNFFRTNALIWLAYYFI